MFEAASYKCFEIHVSLLKFPMPKFTKGNNLKNKKNIFFLIFARESTHHLPTDHV